MVKKILSLLIILLTLLPALPQAGTNTAIGNLHIPDFLEPGGSEGWYTNYVANLNKLSIYRNVNEYASLTAAVTAVGSTPLWIIISEETSLAANTNIPATLGIIVTGSGKITLGNYNLVLAPGAFFFGGYNTVFNYSGTGVVTGLSYAYPEWFGARPDNSTASKPGIDRAIGASNHVILQTGTYKYNGSLTTFRASMVFEGQSSFGTVIDFTDNTVSAGILITSPYSVGDFRMRNLTIKGPGKSSGTNVHGLYEYAQLSTGYNVEFDNVLFTDWSGNCYTSETWFNTTYRNVGARRCGGNGREIHGDQSASIINSGNWDMDIGGIGLFIGAGKPFITGYNAENPKHGAKFGRPTGYTTPMGTVLGAGYCYPNIKGMNIESLGIGSCSNETYSNKVDCEAAFETWGTAPTNNGDATSVGIYFSEGSNFGEASAIQIYVNTIQAAYGVYWASMGGTGTLLEGVSFFFSNGGSYPADDRRYAGGYGISASLFIPTMSDLTNYINASITQSIVTMSVDLDTVRFSKAVAAPGFINNQIYTLDNTGAPAVGAGSVYQTGGTTSIWTLQNGTVGQSVMIIAQHTVQITDGTIVLNGSDNWIMNAGDTLTLMLFSDNKWYETGRGNNN